MDIREVLAAMSEDDVKLWQQHRTEMRRSYMTAHNSALGLAAWDMYDDAFLDLIDIKLVYIFDRAGRIAAHKPLVNEGAADKIETAIIKQSEKVAGNIPSAKELLSSAQALTAASNQIASAATTSMQANNWPSTAVDPKEIVAK